MLGGLFVAVTLFLPRGIVGTLAAWLDARSPSAAVRRAPKRATRRSRPCKRLPPSNACRNRRKSRRSRGSFTGARPAASGGAAAGGGARSAIFAEASQRLLYLDNVTVSFDGFKALNGLSLVVDAGEMRAIIGPNGAGKTTMMDVITGKTRPDQGDVYFEGNIDLTRHDEAEIAELGIGRKFQKPTVFESHTVWDNLELALKGERGVFATLFHEASAPTRARASRRSSRRSASAICATASPAASATARSSGWRSACCSRRTRSCCSSTSRPPA